MLFSLTNGFSFLDIELFVPETHPMVEGYNPCYRNESLFHLSCEHCYSKDTPPLWMRSIYSTYLPLGFGFPRPFAFFFFFIAIIFSPYMSLLPPWYSESISLRLCLHRWCSSNSAFLVLLPASMLYLCMNFSFSLK